MNWRDALVSRSYSNKMSSAIVHHLQYVQQLITNTAKHAVAVVKSAADETKFPYHHSLR